MNAILRGPREYLLGLALAPLTFLLLGLLVIGALSATGCRARDDGISGSGAGGASGGGSGRGGGGGARTGGQPGGGAGGAGGLALPGNGGATADASDGAGDRPVLSGDASADLDVDRPGDGPGQLDVGADVPPRSRPDGTACGAAGECMSGFCSRGICCNRACDEPCFHCAKALNNVADGRCEVNRDQVGRKCGQGCQQVLANIPAVVDKTCDAEGRCLVPQIPQNFELCTDMDPCTTVNCDQDTRANTARCVTIGCGAGQCCCMSAGSQMCLRQDMCTGGDRACAQ